MKVDFCKEDLEFLCHGDGGRQAGRKGQKQLFRTTPAAAADAAQLRVRFMGKEEGGGGESVNQTARE